MKFLTDILSQFYETQNFPEDLCVIQDTRELDIFNSDQKFECVLQSKEWESLRIRELTPYIWRNNGINEDIIDPVCFGWVDNFANLYDHFEKPIHLDEEVVIGWRKI